MKIFVLLCLFTTYSFAQRPAIAEDYKAAKVKSITEKLYDWDEKSKSFKAHKETPIIWRWFYDKNGFVEKEEQFEGSAIEGYQLFKRDNSGKLLKILWYGLDNKLADYTVVDYVADTVAMEQFYKAETNQKVGLPKKFVASITEDKQSIRCTYIAGSNRLAKIEYQKLDRNMTVLYKYLGDGLVEETELHYGQAIRKVCKYLYGWLKTEETVYDTKGQLSYKTVYEIEYYK